MEGIEKKHVIGALVISLVIYLQRQGYFKGMFNGSPSKPSDIPVEELKSTVTKYDLGEEDFRANGIKVFDVDWDKKQFSYLIVMDNQSVQGRYDGAMNIASSNTGGSYTDSTGWKFAYSKIMQKSQAETVTLTISNDKKKYQENKLVNFTNKEVV